MGGEDYDIDSDESSDEDDDDSDISDDSDDIIDFDDDKKINKLYNNNEIIINHSEIIKLNNKKLTLLSKTIKNKNGIVCDPFHLTIPILTKYEKAKILGLRCKQLNNGSKVMEGITFKKWDTVFSIAKKELEKKVLPFIIKRPLPNGECEYWKLKDLEIIDF